MARIPIPRIPANPAAAWEESTWSTRSAASMNDVDTDERRLTIGLRGMAVAEVSTVTSGNIRPGGDEDAGASPTEQPGDEHGRKP